MIKSFVFFGTKNLVSLVNNESPPSLSALIASMLKVYNIDSLAVAEVDSKLNISRITIVTTGTPQVIEQIKLQLKKLVPVHKVADFKREDKNVIFKEMALFKLVGSKSKKEKALKACKKYNAVILDKTNKSYVIQITALRREIDSISKNLKKFGLVSVSRTGAVAMTRGSEVFK